MIFGAPRCSNERTLLLSSFSRRFSNSFLIFFFFSYLWLVSTSADFHDFVLSTLDLGQAKKHFGPRDFRINICAKTELL